MGTGPTTALSRGPSTTLPSGHPPRRISPVPRATLRAKQWSGSQSPATTRRTPSSAFDGRSLHPGTRRGGDRPLLAPPNNTYIQPIGHLDGDVAHDTQSPVERNLTREPMVGVAIRVGLGRGRQSTDRNDSSERGPPSLRKHFRPPVASAIRFRLGGRATQRTAKSRPQPRNLSGQDALQPVSHGCASGSRPRKVPTRTPCSRTAQETSLSFPEVRRGCNALNQGRTNPVHSYLVYCNHSHSFAINIKIGHEVQRYELNRN